MLKKISYMLISFFSTSCISTSVPSEVYTSEISFRVDENGHKNQIVKEKKTIKLKKYIISPEGSRVTTDKVIFEYFVESNKNIIKLSFLKKTGYATTLHHFIPVPNSNLWLAFEKTIKDHGTVNVNALIFDEHKILRKDFFFTYSVNNFNIKKIHFKPDVTFNQTMVYINFMEFKKTINLKK